MRAYDVAVGADWVDYNQHMTEWAYGVAFADASDQVLVDLGFDARYRATRGGTFYTVETHTRFLREVLRGTTLSVAPTVLAADAKRLRLWHEMSAGEQVVATQESVLVHVDIATRRVVPLRDDVLEVTRRQVSAPADGVTRHLVRPLRD